MEDTKIPSPPPTLPPAPSPPPTLAPVPSPPPTLAPVPVNQNNDALNQVNNDIHPDLEGLDISPVAFKKSNSQDEPVEHFNDNFMHSEQITAAPQVQYSKENSNDKKKLKFTKSKSYETIFTEVCLISKDMSHGSHTNSSDKEITQVILDTKPSEQHIELDCNLKQSLSEVDILSHEILPESMKHNDKLPIISLAHETPENDTAPCPITANAVHHIVAPKLARNSAATSNEDLIDNDDPSHAEPLHLLTMFGDAPRNPGNFNAKTMAWYWHKYERDKFATNIHTHDQRNLDMRLD